MSEATYEAPRNPVTWWEIGVTDLDRAKAFYTGVCGWDYQDFGEGFSIVVIDGQMVGGLSVEQGEPGRGVRAYLAADDLDAMLAAVVAHGGEVVAPPAAIGEGFGWFALFRDPEGVVLGVASAAAPPSAG